MFNMKSWIVPIGDEGDKRFAFGSISMACVSDIFFLILTILSLAIDYHCWVSWCFCCFRSCIKPGFPLNLDSQV